MKVIFFKEYKIDFKPALVFTGYTEYRLYSKYCWVLFRPLKNIFSSFINPIVFSPSTFPTSVHEYEQFIETHKKASNYIKCLSALWYLCVFILEKMFSLLCSQCKTRVFCLNSISEQN